MAFEFKLFEFIAARQVLKLKSEKNFSLQVYQILNKLPQIECSFTVKGWWEGGSGTQEKRYVDTSHEGTYRIHGETIAY